jgi:transposase-like protein
MITGFSSGFIDEEQARVYFESIRWEDGPVCPQCGAAGSSKLLGVKVSAGTHRRPGTRQCRICRKQYTVTVGTMFEDSHIPLRKWLMAIEEMRSREEGMRAIDVQRVLQLGSYRTAWRMCRRLRWAFQRERVALKISLSLEEAVRSLLQVKLEGRDKPRGERARGAKLERRPRNSGDR